MAVKMVLSWWEGRHEYQTDRRWSCSCMDLHTLYLINRVGYSSLGALAQMSFQMACTTQR